jgi:imidazolonepropionase-like amidohydrolase
MTPARFTTLALVAAVVAQPAPPLRTLAITFATVVDVSAPNRDAAITAGQTIVISNGRIAAVGDSATTTVPADARRIDGRGKFVIPGLWDMHAHALAQADWTFPLMIATGVTGIREMGTFATFDRIRQLRQETLDGTRVGPRLGATTARVLEGVGGRGGPMTEVGTADEGRRIVREYKQQGIDFIKPYNLLPRDVYLAIVDEAKRQQMPVGGHVPIGLTAIEVSDLGQVSIEHAYDVAFVCSREEAAARAQRAEDAKARPAGPWPQSELRAADTYDEAKAATAFQRFVTNRTWITPTLVQIKVAAADANELARDERLAHVPAANRENWRAQAAQRLGGPAAAMRQRLFEKRIDLVRAMYRAHVPMLAGTDMLLPYVIPGFGLHEELELLVRAGLTPLDALRTATLNPATFLNRERDLGTIARGKLADLVVLEANPLDDIRATRTIAAVIAAGRLHDRASLDALLAAK